MDGSFYDEAYFLHGKSGGKSLYDNYRWMPELTVPMVEAIAKHCGFRPGGKSRIEGDSILDFGCARGYVVKALRSLGYRTFGVDCSEWAIQNADPEVGDFVHLLPKKYLYGTLSTFDWIIAKDVLGHIENVKAAIDVLQMYANVGMFVVVPLSDVDDDIYVVPEYEKDVTHVQRLTLQTWAGMFMRPEWSVTAQYRVSGVKDNYAYAERGNGFITARRLEMPYP